VRVKDLFLRDGVITSLGGDMPSAAVSCLVLAAVALAASCRGQKYVEGQGEMSFFVTSVRAADGGNFGGLAGADAHCLKLAQAAGSAKRQWRAYLSADATGTAPAVHARDRIGRGPWFNAAGVMIASDIDALHRDNLVNQETALDEEGSLVSGQIHDMITGSKRDGTLEEGATCRAWTSDGPFTVVGHHNRHGNEEAARSWNAAHVTDNCKLEGFQRSSGDARFYCFALD
jgi:hypothetical protein